MCAMCTPYPRSLCDSWLNVCGVCDSGLSTITTATVTKWDHYIMGDDSPKVIMVLGCRDVTVVSIILAHFLWGPHTQFAVVLPT